MGRALSRYGITVDTTALKEYAHRQGIKDKISTMTDAQKEFLRANMIQEEANRLMGDSADRAKTAQGQWKEFTSQVHNLMAEMGQPILIENEAIIDQLGCHFRLSPIWVMMKSAMPVTSSSLNTGSVSFSSAGRSEAIATI